MRSQLSSAAIVVIPQRFCYSSISSQSEWLSDDRMIWRFGLSHIGVSTHSQKTGETEVQKTPQTKIVVVSFVSPLSVVDRWVTHASLCRGGGRGWHGSRKERDDVSE
jgi:hypothetical protein